ncbi:hypothetical protein [Actinoplanes sp. NPDC023714]|uniref:hypothetical protein n=1 Tax=Actinoplanes sp. NPDC023714 TaxID=3154322 RepID=UPI00340F8FFA
MRRWRLAAGSAVTLVATLGAVVPGASPAAAAGELERVSVRYDGTQGDDDSGLNLADQSTSDNGRDIVFDSFATNLVSPATSGLLQVFVRNRVEPFTELISVSDDGVPANNISGMASISGNGRFVAFLSIADNLVPGDTNGAADVFVRDRDNGTTERVSLTSGGAEADESSYMPSVSDDGRRVAFVSLASNLVAGDTNDNADIFVRDRQAGTTTRVSVSSTGTQANQGSNAPAISGGGEHVSFTSDADNLVPGDTNAGHDVFVRALTSGTTERVSVATGGAQSNSLTSSRSSMSDDGRYVGFASTATNLVPSDTNGAADVFVRDRQAGTTERVSLSTGGAQGDADSSGPSLSDDGRYVAFPSSAANLVASDTNAFTDVFVRDRQAGTTVRVSLAASGAESNGDSGPAFISGNGQIAGFGSDASNLVPADTNDARDVFVRDLTGDACTITGTSGNDTLTGTGSADVICGLGGNDTINGGGGDDIITAGSGNDTVDGGSGADTIDGGDGADTINGGGGNDALTGGDGADGIDGGGGADDITAGSGNDTVDGGSGTDTIDGGDGADTINGGGGNDTIGGGPGNDDLEGQGGHDTLTDHAGTDTAYGDAGNDQIDVQDGAGGDTANGGIGTDTCATDSGDTAASC